MEEMTLLEELRNDMSNTIRIRMENPEGFQHTKKIRPHKIFEGMTDAPTPNTKSRIIDQHRFQDVLLPSKITLYGEDIDDSLLEDILKSAVYLELPYTFENRKVLTVELPLIAFSNVFSNVGSLASDVAMERRAIEVTIVLYNSYSQYERGLDSILYPCITSDCSAIVTENNVFIMDYSIQSNDYLDAITCADANEYTKDIAHQSIRLRYFYELIGAEQVGDMTYKLLRRGSLFTADVVSNEHVLELTLSGAWSARDTIPLHPHEEISVRKFLIRPSHHQLVETTDDLLFYMDHYGNSYQSMNVVLSYPNCVEGSSFRHVREHSGINGITPHLNTNVVMIDASTDLNKIQFSDNYDSVKIPIANGKYVNIIPESREVRTGKFRIYDTRFNDDWTISQKVDRILDPLSQADDYTISSVLREPVNVTVIYDGVSTTYEYAFMGAIHKCNFHNIFTKELITKDKATYVALLHTMYDGCSDTDDLIMFGFIDLQDNTFHTTSSVYNHYWYKNYDHIRYRNTFTTGDHPYDGKVFYADIIGAYHYIIKQNPREYSKLPDQYEMIAGGKGILYSSANRIHYFDMVTKDFKTIHVPNFPTRTELYTVSYIHASVDDSNTHAVIQYSMKNSKLFQELKLQSENIEYPETAKRIVNRILAIDLTGSDTISDIVVPQLKITHHENETHLFHICGIKTPFKYLLTYDRVRTLSSLGCNFRNTIFDKNMQVHKNAFNDLTIIPSVNKLFPSEVELQWFSEQYHDGYSNYNYIANIGDIFTLVPTSENVHGNGNKIRTIVNRRNYLHIKMTLYVEQDNREQKAYTMVQDYPKDGIAIYMPEGDMLVHTRIPKTKEAPFELDDLIDIPLAKIEEIFKFTLNPKKVDSKRGDQLVYSYTAATPEYDDDEVVEDVSY